MPFAFENAHSQDSATANPEKQHMEPLTNSNALLLQGAAGLANAAEIGHELLKHGLLPQFSGQFKMIERTF